MKVGDLVIYKDDESYFNGRTGIVTRFVQTNWDGLLAVVFLHQRTRKLGEAMMNPRRVLGTRYLMDDPKYFKVL